MALPVLKAAITLQDEMHTDLEIEFKCTDYHVQWKILFHMKRCVNLVLSRQFLH